MHAKRKTFSSAPEYAPIQPAEHASSHVIVADRTGVEAVLRFAKQLRIPDDGRSVPVNVLLESGAERIAELPAQRDVTVAAFETGNDLDDRLAKVLAGATMGTHFYLIGSEAFIWPVVAAIEAAGVDRDSISCECSAPEQRQVYCLHCKTVSVAERLSVVPCSGCGVQLTVTEHFSKRLGAYFGYRADAEEPGNVPEAVEVPL